MILGRVVGEVWGARRHAGLEGRKLLLVRPYLWYAPSHEVDVIVAVDEVGAGPGEDVIVCLGDGARRSLGKTNLPVEASVLGIVDQLEIASDVGKRPLTFVGAVAPAGWPTRGAP